MKSIDPERWAQIAEILDSCLDLPSSERAAFLDRACAGAPDLRPEIEELLRADTEAGGFLETPILESEDPVLAILASGRPPEGDLPAHGQRVGPYRLVHELGRGGMGVVYLAERADGQFEQQVALKLVKRGMDSEEILRRFRAERQILARLEHPSIARLLDGGIAEDGRPYFALEYVRGSPITTFVAEGKLDLDARVRLFCLVCAAVAYAQQNLIVHRDLKPSNILVNHAGIPKLLDFGIAKLLDPAHGEEHTALTSAGARPLTPLYAAPEQLQEEAVTTATDVYSLGIVLYEVLAGMKPFAVEGRSPAEIRRMVLRAELRPIPSTIPPDLAAIVRKAIQIDPAARYASAQALLDDLERYRRHLPVRAHESSRAYAVRKFLRRHRTAAIAAASPGVVLVAGLIATTWQARIAERNAARAEQITRFLTGAFTIAAPDGSQGATLSAREMLARAAGRVEEELSREPDLQAELLSVLSSIQLDWGAYDEAADLAERACSLATGTPEPKLALAHALRAAGSAYLQLGQFDRARAALQRGLTVCPGRSHAAIEARTDLMDELGAVAIDQFQYARAESLFRESLRLCRRSLRDQPLRASDCMNGLAISLRRQEKLEEAETFYREALAIRRRHLPADHTDITTSLSNLATLLRSQGKLEEAEGLVREAIEMQRRLFAGDHPDLANTLNELGVILREKGEYREALAIQSEALGISQRLLGEEHPVLGLRYNELAATQIACGDFAAADTLTRHALRIYSARYGEAHERTFSAQRRRVAVLREMGRFDEAETILRAAMTFLGKKYGEESPEVARLWSELGAVERARREPRDAESALRHAIAIFQSQEEDSAPAERITTCLRLSGVMRDLQRLAEADSLCGRAAEIQGAAVPPDHPRAAILFHERGLVLHALGHDEEAAESLEKALAIRTRCFGPEHWFTAEILGALAVVRGSLGERAEASAAARSSVATLRSVPWKTEPSWQEVERVIRPL